MNAMLLLPRHKHLSLRHWFCYINFHRHCRSLYRVQFILSSVYWHNRFVGHCCTFGWWWLACIPLSVGVVTSKAAADSPVDDATVVQSSVKSIRKCTALRWNWRGVVAYTENSMTVQQLQRQIGLLHAKSY